jgi:GNAT superfamily N-acetyltransferase
MSRTAQIGVESPAASWVVLRACHDDVTGVVVAVQELLLELGSTPPSAGVLDDVVRELIADRDAGALLVARARGERGQIVGVLAASWQLAIHIPGRYALIQDLWVHSAWRSRSIGADLMTALVELARERAMSRIEVGLPRESFGGIEATEAFYRDHGFQPLGPRMRRLI